MRASHDLRADLTLLTANKMSGGQQLFGSNNLVIAGSEQENWAPYYREINRASERCETASCKLIVFIEPLNDLEIIGAGEIDGARAPNGGLIGVGSLGVRLHRDLIVGLAARHKLPAVYFERVFVDAGGLLSYGANYIEQFRLAAGYIDGILKGETPAELPVQAPTRYETVLNLKTAKALGLDVPASVLARADEVIE